MSALHDAQRLALALERSRKESPKAVRGLTKAQERVLFAIDDYGPVSHARLSSALRIDKSQVSKAVAALIGRGLVNSTPSAKHKKQSDLLLSDEGRRLVEGIESGLAENGLAKFVERIGPKGRSNLEELSRLITWVEERHVSEAPTLNLRLADEQDLVWLLGRWARSAKGWDPLSTLAEGLVDMVEHLRVTVDFAHHWVVLSNGVRAGGVAMSTDENETENAWIKLLYTNAENREVTIRLIRKCREAADARGYEWVRIKVYQSDTLTREVLGELGFNPVATEQVPLPGGNKMRMTYGVQLLPELRL